MELITKLKKTITIKKEFLLKINLQLAISHINKNKLT